MKKITNTFLLLFVILSANAQVSTFNFITNVKYSNGNPVALADVVIDDNEDYKAKTDVNGRALIKLPQRFLKFKNTNIKILINNREVFEDDFTINNELSIKLPLGLDFIEILDENIRLKDAIYEVREVVNEEYELKIEGYKRDIKKNLTKIDELNVKLHELESQKQILKLLLREESSKKDSINVLLGKVIEQQNGLNKEIKLREEEVEILEREIDYYREKAFKPDIDTEIFKSRIETLKESQKGLKIEVENLKEVNSVLLYENKLLYDSIESMSLKVGLNSASGVKLEKRNFRFDPDKGINLSYKFSEKVGLKEINCKHTVFYISNFSPRQEKIFETTPHVEKIKNSRFNVTERVFLRKKHLKKKYFKSGFYLLELKILLDADSDVSIYSRLIKSKDAYVFLGLQSDEVNSSK